MESIIKNNIIIARFMGFGEVKNYDPDTPLSFYATEEYYDIVNVDEEIYDFEVILPDDLGFDKKWDWLMPVVEKINTMGYPVEIHYHSTLIFDFLMYNQIINKPYGYGGEKNMLDHTYNAVIDFIKWYNETKRG